MREQIFEGPGNEAMQTYVIEIVLILLGAFILGYVLRWLLNDKLKRKISKLEMELSMLKMKSKPEESFEELEKNVMELQNSIDELKSELNNERVINNSLRASLNSVQSELKTRMAQEAKPLVHTESKEEAKPEEKEEVVKEVVLSTSTKDDLKIIEGIGPKIEQILNQGSISTYADLVAKDAADIKKILTDVSPTYAVHNPSTWAEQAKLAIEGKWDELKALQQELKAGNRR